MYTDLPPLLHLPVILSAAGILGSRLGSHKRQHQHDHHHHHRQTTPTTKFPPSIQLGVDLLAALELSLILTFQLATYAIPASGSSNILSFSCPSLVAETQQLAAAELLLSRYLAPLWFHNKGSSSSSSSGKGDDDDDDDVAWALGFEYLLPRLVLIAAIALPVLAAGGNSRCGVHSWSTAIWLSAQRFLLGWFLLVYM